VFIKKMLLENKPTSDGKSIRLNGLRAVTLMTGAAASVLCSGLALANPAPNATSFSQSAAGTMAAQTVPDGTCRVAATVKAGAGASQGTGGTGGRGAGGATINATFDVLPLQSLSGTVAGGGLAASGGGSGASAGGAGGTAAQHRGAGGGGSSTLSAAGVLLVQAGGGGGGAAAHDAAPAGNGGAGGTVGIGAGVVAAGVIGANGTDSPGVANGGKGGQATAGGAGGVNTSNAAFSGFAGGGIGAGIGGNGGNDTNPDSGGGGGGGYTGGGGGASTTSSTVSGAGGGGGSSFVRATAPTAEANAPTAISGSEGAQTAQGAVNGAAGAISIDYIPCQYTLGISKSVSTSLVGSGGKVVWTVAVTNSGPDPMTRGDTVTLADTLPSGPNASVAPAFKVLSVGTSGGAHASLARTAFSCTGVTVGGSMPSSTDCARPYSATSSPGAPAGGLRGLDSGETLTITYEQVISNTATCQTINNVVSTSDRSTLTGTADIIGNTVARSANQSLTVECYDLAITKTATPGTVSPTQDAFWTITVTNAGLGPMKGTDDPAANPLIVSDVAPTADLSTPFSFTATGPAGPCTYVSGSISCALGLAAGQSETFNFRQTLGGAAVTGTTRVNTATVTDFKSGDSNDSANATITVGVIPPVVLAANDTASGIDGAAGVPNVVNAFTGDVIGGVSANATNAQLSLSVGEVLPAGVSFDVATGNISVAPGTSGGSYSFDYQICQSGVPTNCAIGTISLTVIGTTLAATDDTASGINGVIGAPNALNLRNGDTINGDPATSANSTLSIASGSSVPAGLTFDTASGNVAVAPGTLAGTYSFNYQICSTVSPTTCKVATASVTVSPSIDLVLTKSNATTSVTSGATTVYMLSVTNFGPDAAIGAIVSDVPGTGLTCPVANAVTITGDGVPAGSFTIADLTGAGVTLSTLSSGQTASLTYSCQVN
jgi:uncharacterized repeat protein (TIGR01451 family)